VDEREALPDRRRGEVRVRQLVAEKTKKGYSWSAATRRSPQADTRAIPSLEAAIQPTPTTPMHRLRRWLQRRAIRAELIVLQHANKANPGSKLDRR
jgi:hypothetical protein